MFKVTSKNNFINAITLLICLIPTSLIIGAAISEFFLSLAALLFLIYTLIYKDWNYYKKKIFIILIFFYIYILFSSLISEFPINSLRSSAFYFRFYFFSLAIWFLLDNSKNFLKYFFFSIFFTLTFAFVYSLFEIFDSIRFANKLADYRISGFFGTELIQGSFFLRLLTVFVGVYILLNNNKYNFIFNLIFFISIFTILVSGERSSIGLLFIFLFVFFIFYSLKILKKITILVFIFFIMFSSIYYLPGLKQRIFINTKNLILENEKVNFFSRGHQEHYESALKMFKKNIITGVGIRNFRLECRKAEYNYIGVNACTTHPHNTYIQFLAETGVIGLIFILSIFFYFCKFLIVNFLTILKRQPINQSAVFFAIAIFINLFPFVPTGSFFNNWLSTLYYLPIAFFFYSLDKEKNDYHI
jgi:O-antigen ligase